MVSFNATSVVLVVPNITSSEQYSRTLKWIKSATLISGILLGMAPRPPEHFLRVYSQNPCAFWGTHSEVFMAHSWLCVQGSLVAGTIYDTRAQTWVSHVGGKLPTPYLLYYCSGPFPHLFDLFFNNKTDNQYRVTWRIWVAYQLPLAATQTIPTYWVLYKKFSSIS